MVLLLDRIAQTGQRWRRRQAKRDPPCNATQSITSLTRTTLTKTTLTRPPWRLNPAWPSKQFCTVGSDIVPAFHFLHLIDDQGRPSPSLADLVATLGTETWPERLSAVLTAAYPDIIAIGIARVTPKDVLVQLRKRYAIDAARGRQATAFLVHALSDAELDEGSFMPRRTRARPQAFANAPVPRASALLEKLPPFDQAWSDDLKLAWLTAFNEVAMGRR